MKAKKCTETLIPLLLEGETDQEIIRRNMHSAIVACIESTSIEHLQQILDIDNMDQYIDQTLYNWDSFLHLAAQLQSNDIRM